MSKAKYTIGLDYGTDSVRALIVNAFTGEAISDSVYYYPRWKEGLYCDSSINMFRQHPQDYLQGLEYSVSGALKKVPEGVAANIVGITVDTTGSTPVAVDKAGTPLALKDEFAENPNAMFVLWKDHTAIMEAKEINDLCQRWAAINYTKYVGGIYSSEWFWAKILHISRVDEDVRDEAFSWVEHCDWITAVLVGDTDPLRLKRSRCAAGHKAMWNAEFGGLPSEEFLSTLDPLLSGMRNRLYNNTYSCDEIAGNLAPEWALKLSLPANVLVGVGSFDAHMGALGAEIKPNYLSKVMGTSTCDMLIASKDEVGDKLIAGICGQVDGSIIPGVIGLEAGQSAFGDTYAWFARLLGWSFESIGTLEYIDSDTRERIIKDLSDQLIIRLTNEAAKIPIASSGIVALDWLNGRRTPDTNQSLKGAIAGLNLGADAPGIFRALVESTAFGARAIVERFKSEGIEIEGVIALGGVAKKSDFVMQIVSDVLNMPIKVVRSEQTCALGSAMSAAVVAGVYSTIYEAQLSMGNGFEREYTPIKDNVKKYEKLYNSYLSFGRYVEQWTEE